MKAEDIERLIGKGENSSEAQAILQELGEPEWFESEGRRHAQYFSQGVALVFDKNNGLIAGQLFSSGKDGYNESRISLPEGFSFSQGRQEARSVFGSPIASKDAASIPVLGKVAAWDQFEINGIVLHLEYGEDEKNTVLVSVMTKESVPT